MKKLLLIGLTLIATNLHSQNKIESSLQENYVNGIWENNSGTNYEYDSNDNLLSETYVYWDVDVWLPSYKTFYTYNANNKALTQTNQYVNANTNQYLNDYKISYTYNGAGKLITILEQEWENNSWVNSTKSDVTYNGNLIALLNSLVWNGTAWVADRKSTPTYTGANLTQILDEEWDGVSYNNKYRETLTHDTNNRVINDNSEIWESSWVEDENISYILAANGNRMSLVNSYYQEFDYKEEYNYDTTAQMSSFANPFQDQTGLDYFIQDYPYVNKILNYTTSFYDTSTSTYSLDSKTTYNYQSQLPLGKEKFEISKITIYPNPANSMLNVQMDQDINTISIVDISGRTTAVKTISNASFDVSTLASGVYFLEIKTDTSVFREKFIKN